MATDLSTLVDSLNWETNRTLEVPELLDLLKAGVGKLNSVLSRGFDLTGTELDRDASKREQRAIVMCATLIWLNGQVIGASTIAITHSNVAGRTKLDGIEFAMAKRRKELLETEVEEMLQGFKTTGVASEASAHELGETKDMTQPSPFISVTA